MYTWKEKIFRENSFFFLLLSYHLLWARGIIFRRVTPLTDLYNKVVTLSPLHEPCHIRIKARFLYSCQASACPLFWQAALASIDEEIKILLTVRSYVKKNMALCMGNDIFWTVQEILGVDGSHSLLSASSLLYWLYSYLSSFPRILISITSPLVPEKATPILQQENAIQFFCRKIAMKAEHSTQIINHTNSLLCFSQGSIESWITITCS